ncbi:hypothetical protein [Natronoglycomyces albus]|uniref:Uncharacterized protein n=1 Tax=Natronoglycomyces albus TaxID=2811108 RepID=A0A895XRI4_9ACTN|nr:hypothetical protein [Natronoglycomyces albus]QSB04870.1 hypothetical protein JQS30_14045 [Natronoglycomyces albus]
MALPAYYLEYATSVSAREAIEFFAGRLGADIVDEGDHEPDRALEETALRCVRGDLSVYAYEDPPQEFSDYIVALGLDIEKILVVSFDPEKQLTRSRSHLAMDAEIVDAVKHFVTANEGTGYFTMDFTFMLGDFTGDRPAFDVSLMERSDFNAEGDFDSILSDVEVRPLEKLE